MVQPAEKFSEEEYFRLVVHGTSFAMYEANLDKEKYIKYKNGQLNDVPSEKIIEMEILNILENLGYSINELGTYLYKDLIAYTYEDIKDITSRKDMEKCKNIMLGLNNAFSGTYHYIAREWKEIGIKSFHLYIEKAIKNMDDTAVNIELSKKIFGDNPEEISYGLQAFQIAAYVAKKYSFDNTKEYKKPLVRRLPNMPDDLVLKDNF